MTTPRTSRTRAGAPARLWTRTLSELEARLTPAADPGTFTSAELDGLPEPVLRHLTAAIAPGTPLARSARLRMRGSIKIGRWLPFTARQVECPHEGFVWAARVAGLVAGSDRYADDVGVMDWKLAGLVTLMHADGPDISRSAAGRAGAEAIWVPTTLLPRFGASWRVEDDRHVAVRHDVGETPVEVRYRLDRDGHIVSFVFDRWGDPDGTGAWTWLPFGGEITGYRTFDGVTIPSAGRVGWFFGTERWPGSAFFRYEITGLQLVVRLPPRGHSRSTTPNS